MVLDIKKLNVTLNKDSRILVRDFSFTLNPGDKAALIGEEGNGKSTLLKLIYDPELVEGYCTFSGEINRHGAVLGYLEQEMLPNDLKLSIYEYFLKYTTEKSQNPSTVSDVFVKLGLDPGIFYDPQPVGTLSGGEKIKLQLARILLGEPDILLLDEPTNDLDIETVEWMENFIASTTLPVLYISHDETLLENTANVIIHLEQLRKRSSRDTRSRKQATETMSKPAQAGLNTRKGSPERNGRSTKPGWSAGGRSTARSSTGKILSLAPIRAEEGCTRRK